jgi:hypothetical protein
MVFSIELLAQAVVTGLLIGGIFSLISVGGSIQGHDHQLRMASSDDLYVHLLVVKGGNHT